MRLLMLSWRGPGHPLAGGAEAYTSAILTELARRGHAVTWFCEGGTPPPGVSLVTGSPVYRAGTRYLRRHARDLDLVVDQINGRGFLTPWTSPIPVLTFIHQLAADLWAYDPSPFRRLVGPTAERILLRPYRRLPFVTVSESTRTDLRRLGWTGSAHLAYNGVTIGPTAPKEVHPTLVFLGRLQAPGKRLDHAIAVFRLLRLRIPDLRLWVLGRGAIPRDLPEGVEVFLDVPQTTRDDRLARAWLLVATSRREGWGRMVLEAAAVGTACAVYETPGLGEVGRAVGGVITPAHPEALAAAAGDMLADPAALFARGRQAQERVAAFTWERAADVWEVAMREVL